MLLLPPNERAEPCFAVDVHVAFEMVPVLPCPDASATVEPVFSSNEYAATSPGGVAACASCGRKRALAMRARTNVWAMRGDKGSPPRIWWHGWTAPSRVCPTVRRETAGCCLRRRLPGRSERA